MFLYVEYGVLKMNHLVCPKGYDDCPHKESMEHTRDHLIYKHYYEGNSYTELIDVIYNQTITDLMSDLFDDWYGDYFNDHDDYIYYYSKAIRCISIIKDFTDLISGGYLKNFRNYYSENTIELFKIIFSNRSKVITKEDFDYQLKLISALISSNIRNDVSCEKQRKIYISFNLCDSDGEYYNNNGKMLTIEDINKFNEEHKRNHR